MDSDLNSSVLKEYDGIPTLWDTPDSIERFTYWPESHSFSDRTGHQCIDIYNYKVKVG